MKIENSLNGGPLYNFIYPHAIARHQKARGGRTPAGLNQTTNLQTLNYKNYLFNIACISATIFAIASEIDAKLLCEALSPIDAAIMLK